MLGEWDVALTDETVLTVAFGFAVANDENPGHPCTPAASAAHSSSVTSMIGGCPGASAQ